jgi:hypothetical protein
MKKAKYIELLEKPPKMTEEVWKLYKDFLKNPDRFKKFYPVIFHNFIEPYILEESSNEKTTKS